MIFFRRRLSHSSPLIRGFQTLTAWKIVSHRLTFSISANQPHHRFSCGLLSKSAFHLFLAFKLVDISCISSTSVSWRLSNELSLPRRLPTPHQLSPPPPPPPPHHPQCNPPPVPIFPISRLPVPIKSSTEMNAHNVSTTRYHPVNLALTLLGRCEWSECLSYVFQWIL
jgi:hypothetical protein